MPEPLREFPSPLRREIDSQPRAAAEERTRQLMQMPVYEFTRACNIAKNRELAGSLGLKPRANNLKRGRNRQGNGSSKSTGNRVSHNTDVRSLRSTSQRGEKETVGTDLNEVRTRVDPLQRTDDSCDETQTETQATSTTSEPSPDTLRPADESHAAIMDNSTPNLLPVQVPQLSQRAALVEVVNSSELSQSQPPAKAAKPQPVFAINKTAWPGWLAEKYNYYASFEFGDKWRECLFVWTELERAFKFCNPVSYFFFP
jgi:hypothetical protein